MSLKAVIFLRNRTYIERKIKDNWNYLKFRKSLYEIDPLCISNRIKKGELECSEIMYFEGNPNPIGKGEDKSLKILEEMILENLIQNTSRPPIKIGELFEGLRFLGNPVNWVWIGLGLAVIYAIITNLGSGLI